MSSTVVSSRSTVSTVASTSTSTSTRIRPRGVVANRPTTRTRAASDGETSGGAPMAVTTVTIAKPLGLTLEAGRGDVGAFVANVAEDSNAALATPTAARYDVVRAVNGRDVRNASFDDILDAIVDGPDPATLTLATWRGGPDATTPRDRCWLESKSALEDVTTLESGLMYRVLRSGSGPGNIKMDTVCECHYVGTLADETTEFDSSRRRGKPLAFAPRQVILAWREAMRLMREGDEWELFCPADLAYGGRGSGRFIKPGDALRFVVSVERVP